MTPAHLDYLASIATWEAWSFGDTIPEGSLFRDHRTGTVSLVGEVNCHGGSYRHDMEYPGGDVGTVPWDRLIPPAEPERQRYRLDDGTAGVFVDPGPGLGELLYYYSNIRRLGAEDAAPDFGAPMVSAVVGGPIYGDATVRAVVAERAGGQVLPFLTEYRGTEGVPECEVSHDGGATWKPVAKGPTEGEGG